jgi:desulfoferrodoxin-like iron-binding protein
MALFVCSVCGHVEFGSAPDRCPVCWAPKDKFSQNDRVFIEAEEKSKEASVKHIPAVTVNKVCGLIPEQHCADVIVRIGKTLHPAEPAHFIKWIDCYVDDQFVERAQLTPNVNPAACFHLKKEGSSIRVVEFCNIHGHWQAEGPLGP